MDDKKKRVSDKEFIPSSRNASQYTAPDLLPPLLLEYEAFVAALQEQIEFYKRDHATLRNDLMELVAENRCLSDRLKDELSTKFTKESTISLHHEKESEMLTNIQQQLSLTVHERDSAVEMWHMALWEVDNLEETLKSYQDNRHVDLSQKKIENMKQDFSNAVMMLESKLATTRSNLAKEKGTREEIQKRLDDTIQENLSLTLTLKSRQQELEEALEGQCATARKLQEIEKKSEELEEQVKNIKKAENDLELALTRCHDQIDELIQKNSEAREKVSESLHLVECAMAEKDAAVLSETQTREENVQLQKMLASIVDEAGARVKEEVENIKQQYNKKLEVLLHDMKKMEDENNEREKKLKKEVQEKHVLEEELQKIQMESPLATRKLTMAYDELSDLKRCNMQLGIEKETLRSEMERMQENHTLEIRKMNMEHHLMEERMLGLQAQLERENRAKGKRGEYVEKLTEQACLLEHKFENRHLFSKKELEEWQQQQYEQEHQKWVTQIQEIQKQSNATTSELEHHLEKQHLMKTKYQKAMKTMTKKFVMRLQELHSEASALRKENKDLKSHLQKLQDEVATHKASVKNDL